MRPFNEMGIIVYFGQPDSSFWEFYSAHTLQRHDLFRPIRELDVEDAFFDKLVGLFKIDGL